MTCLSRLAALALAASAVACGATPSTPATNTAPDAGTVKETTLYERLGGNAGLTTAVNGFIGRVVADAKINGYFLNRSVDGGHLAACLVKQLGAATGGPEVYDCKTMKAAHAGMGVSAADFGDLAGHLVAELKALGVAQADIDVIVGVLTPMAADIVEDKDNDKTVYQRVGRKPAVIAVIDGFVAKVAADARINGFFAATNIDRLKTCLVRQVSSIDGPVKYGQEVDAPTLEKGVGLTNACRTMLASHANLMNPAAGGASAKPITKADFDALVDDLVQTLDGTAVTPADKAALLGVLGPLCTDIVKDASTCNPT